MLSKITGLRIRTPRAVRRAMPWPQRVAHHARDLVPLDLPRTPSPAGWVVLGCAVGAAVLLVLAGVVGVIAWAVRP